MRILVDQSFWTALMDESSPRHAESQEKFTDVMSENHIIYVTNFIVNETLFYLRQNLSGNERELMNIMTNAMDNNYLKVVFLGRLTQREILKMWKKYPDWPYHPMDLANISVMKKRFLQGMLTWRKEYREFGINILNL